MTHLALAKRHRAAAAGCPSRPLRQHQPRCGYSQLPHMSGRLAISRSRPVTPVNSSDELTPQPVFGLRCLLDEIADRGVQSCWKIIEDMLFVQQRLAPPPVPILTGRILLGCLDLLEENGPRETQTSNCCLAKDAECRSLAEAARERLHVPRLYCGTLIVEHLANDRRETLWIEGRDVGKSGHSITFTTTHVISSP